MSEMLPKFPDWFVPQGQCPPADAVDTSGEIFCFASKVPVTPEEFRSYHEKGDRPNGRLCERCGLSVFKKAEHVRRLLLHLWKNYPEKVYGPHIVRRELTPSDGKIKPTGGKDHHTWWAYEGVERHASFTLVETAQIS